MPDEWSGLYCRHCSYEASQKLARRGRGYCLDCGRRLGSLSGGRNLYPIRRKLPAPTEAERQAEQEMSSTLGGCFLPVPEGGTSHAG